ncbi:MAG: SEL1-like repeat protein [Bacteroidaceae bacterium]|nr:SEL1-like repeat protein [Bacteroidaceae bacterium]
MKTIMTVAGSVIPGFGNVAGFVAGTAIDVLAGDKINKFVDNIADAFEDDKVYQFSCPNCGHEWKDVGDDSVGMFSASSSTGRSSSSTVSRSAYEALYELQFSQFLDDILDKYGKITQIGQLKELFSSVQASTPMIKDNKVRSKYAYTGAMLALDCVMHNWGTLTDKQKEYYLNRADDSIKSALKAMPNSVEYQLMRDAIYSLKHRTVEEQLEMGTEYYLEHDFEDAVFKYDFLLNLYETSRYLIIEELACNEDDEQVEEQLWKLLLSFHNVRYLEDAYFSLYFIHKNDTESSGKLSTEAHRFLTKGYELKDYETAIADEDEKWLLLMIEYAVNLVDGRLWAESQDFQRGFAMLQQVAQADFAAFAKTIANRSIGVFYETGEHIPQDLDQALLYYRKADHEEGIKRVSQMMEELSKIGTTSAQGNRCLSEAEQEYLEEYRECLASDNRITSNERRLLDKLRVNLGISSERATELEAMEGNRKG